MLFMVAQDSGSSLIGYLVPDSVTESGQYAIVSGGEEIHRGETDLIHADLVAVGRHQTGRCGFQVTESQIPGLSKIAELDVIDLVSGQIIYRRRRPETLIRKRIFRLETHLLPLAGLDRSLEPSFQLWFPHVDRAGAETIGQTFQMTAASIFVSGRVGYQSIELFLEKSGYESVILMHDPFEELAERLLFLRLVAQRPAGILGERDDVSFAETLAFAREVDLGSEKSLRRAFRSLDPTVAIRLSNPLVRLLGLYDTGDAPTGTAVGKAVTALSTFKLVGVRRRPDLFAEGLADLLSSCDREITVAPPIPAAIELAERLRACREVEDLLDYDLALYHIVSDALEKSSMQS